MIVFVHGVPETAELWDPLRAELDAESVAVSLPGFGNPRPAGFAATKEAYEADLARQLEAIGPPVDLVGHDWGALLTYRIATAHPHLIRSWAIDCANVAHPDYVWHQFAQLWQTEGAGEELFEALLAQPPDERASTFTAMEVPHEAAVDMVSRIDQTMAGCILDLYRSATPNPRHDWLIPSERAVRPGLVVVPVTDPFGDEPMARHVAAELGAGVAVLEDRGHWWPLQDPGAGAAILREFWAGLG